MRDPTGDIPWNEDDSLGSDVIHLSNLQVHFCNLPQSSNNYMHSATLFQKFVNHRHI